MQVTGGVGFAPASIGGKPVLSDTSWPAGAGSDANGQTGLSDGVKTWAIVQRVHRVEQACADFSLLYVNAGSDEHFAAPAGIPSNAITIATTVWKQSGNPNLGGTPVDVTFGGATSYSLTPEQILTSDVIAGPFAAGDLVWERTLVQVAAGGRWPLGTRTVWNSTDGYRTGTGAGPSTDYLHTGTVTPQSGTYTHFAACGSLSTSLVGATPVVGFIGTSIAEGYNDQAHNAHFVQACNARNVPVVRVAHGGSSALRWNLSGNHEIRMALLGQATDVVVEHLTNDFQNSLTNPPIPTVTDWVNCATRLRTLHKMLSDAGKRAYQLTGCPSYNKSTDGWATVGSQSANDKDIVRTMTNAWIRAGCPEKAGVPVVPGTSGAIPSPYLTGWFEVADVVETARDSGVWKQGMTADGIHPTSAGHAAVAATIDLSGIFAAAGVTPPPAPPPPVAVTNLRAIQMVGGQMVSVQVLH